MTHKHVWLEKPIFTWYYYYYRKASDFPCNYSNILTLLYFVDRLYGYMAFVYETERRKRRASVAFCIIYKVDLILFIIIMHFLTKFINFFFLGGEVQGQTYKKHETKDEKWRSKGKKICQVWRKTYISYSLWIQGAMGLHTRIQVIVKRFTSTVFRLHSLTLAWKNQPPHIIICVRVCMYICSNQRKSYNSPFSCY